MPDTLGVGQMCRNIKKLRNPDRPPTDDELRDAALQFVRKISGYHAPSRAHHQAFVTAVHDVARTARTLFDSLQRPGGESERVVSRL